MQNFIQSDIEKTLEILEVVLLLLFTQSCLTLCDPIDYSTPGFPVLHYLPEFVRIHVYWVDDSIQSTHPLLPPFSSCLQSFPSPRSFPVSRLFTSDGQNFGASALASVLSMTIQGWFPLRLAGLISLCKRLTGVFSSTTVTYELINIISYITYILIFYKIIVSQIIKCVTKPFIKIMMIR